MSKKVLNPSVKISTSGHQRRANETDRRAEQVDLATKAPATLLPEDPTNLITKSGNYPVSASLVGHWLRPSQKDTDLEIRRNLILRGDEAKSANTPYGQLMVGDELIDYMKEKKIQQENLAELQLGAYLIDPQRPETQKKAYSILPELRDYPQEYHLQNVAIQEALRMMLVEGEIGGKEDLAVIRHIIRDDYMLPLFPLWDPEGIMIQSSPLGSQIARIFKDHSARMGRGLFSPRNWGVNNVEEDEFLALNRSIKVMILKRLFPGLRDQPIDVIRSILKKPDPMDKITNPFILPGGRPISSNALPVFERAVNAGIARNQDRDLSFLIPNQEKRSGESITLIQQQQQAAIEAQEQRQQNIQ
jgi:hypothetical protein